jgi:ribosomal protein S18 acetylase RimI-like enzyme
MPPDVHLILNPFPTDAALAALWQSGWGNAGPASFQPVLARSLVHVGALAGDRLVGFVNVAWDGGVHATLLDTTVHQDWQRRGIATAMVRLAAEAAGRGGARWLHVDFTDEHAGFYAACGFRPTLAGLMALG